jgi:hypothetical protein
MGNFEITPTFVLFICILVSTFVMSRVEYRIVKKLKYALEKDAEIIGKSTFSNPLQSYTNMVFFFSYKVDHTTPEGVSKLIRRGKYLNVLYLLQLAAVLVCMFYWFDSQAW